MMDSIRRSIRRVVYRTPIHRWLGFGNAHLDKTYWDQQLSGPLKSYLGGTISAEIRNMAVLTLLRVAHPSMTSLLDVGCASGSLVRCPGARGLDYTGIDISDVAINEALRLSPSHRFQTAQLQGYLLDRNYDAILFSEVLYYLSVDDALSEYHRYAAALVSGGLVVVSMKHDPKSESIMQAISRQSTWVAGLLAQEKADGPSWSVSASSRRPAYLIGLFRP
jgi:trans-aconitate methyltransferase